MCGRYATTRSDADLSLLFDAVNVTDGLEPSWNVAPTDPVPLVRVSQRRGGRVLDVAKWGLVPSWSPDLRGGARMINARAETVASSPAFASAFAKRRCLVPADGWYEWVRAGKSKQAYYMTPLIDSELGGAPLAFAGIWTMSGKETLTCSVITTAALGGLAEVHDRMPLIMPRERWPQWLAEPTRGGEPQSGKAEPTRGGKPQSEKASAGDAAALLQPMTPAELEAIEIRPVRPEVGNVRNNGPDLITAFVAERNPATLF